MDEASRSADGLVAAARNYRPSREGTFAAYAATRIRGAIQDELLESLDRPVLTHRPQPRRPVIAPTQTKNALSLSEAKENVVLGLIIGSDTKGLV
jgi:hypothetical protein